MNRIKRQPPRATSLFKARPGSRRPGPLTCKGKTMTPTARSDAPPDPQGAERPPPHPATGLDVCIERTSPPGQAMAPKDALWPSRIRRLAQATLRAWGLADFTDSVELLLSELVTNARRHGHGKEVGVRLRHRA